MLFPNRPPHKSWKPTALVIDKDADLHRSLHVMLGKDFDVHHAYFPRLALSLLEKRSFSVVFTPLDMGNADEMPDLNRTIQSISKDKGIPVIGLADVRTASTAAAGNSEKPIDEEFLAALRAALNTAAAASGAETDQD